MTRENSEQLSAFEECIVSAADRRGVTLKCKSEVSGKELRLVADADGHGQSLVQIKDHLSDVIDVLQAFSAKRPFTVTSSIGDDAVKASLIISIIFDDNLHIPADSDSNSELFHELRKYFEKEMSERQRRPKRKKEDLPDPTQPHGSRKNRYPDDSKVPFSTDMSRAVRDVMREFAKAHGTTNRAVLEAAILEYVERHGPE